QVDGILNRLHVAVPAARDGKARPPVIPPAAAARLQQRANKENRKRKLEREIELEQGDDYVLGMIYTTVVDVSNNNISCTNCPRSVKYHDLTEDRPQVEVIPTTV
ncbi:Probable nucleolar GTP-binding protein 1, partial [Papilio machaon]